MPSGTDGEMGLSGAYRYHRYPSTTAKVTNSRMTRRRHVRARARATSARPARRMIDPSVVAMRSLLSELRDTFLVPPSSTRQPSHARAGRHRPFGAKRGPFGPDRGTGAKLRVTAPVQACAADGSRHFPGAAGPTLSGYRAAA